MGAGARGVRGGEERKFFCLEDLGKVLQGKWQMNKNKGLREILKIEQVH
jgi:hypothetical protein